MQLCDQNLVNDFRDNGAIIIRDFISEENLEILRNGIDHNLENLSERGIQSGQGFNFTVDNFLDAVLIEVNILTLKRPLRRKLWMRWFSDVSKMKESSFSKSDLTDPPQIFDAHLLENTDLSPSRFHFSFKIMFWVRWF